MRESLLNPSLRTHLPALALLLGITVFRLCLMCSHELHVDEAYYWDWSRDLAPGYYDQGPGVAFAIKAGTLLFGDTELGVRAPALFCGFVVALLAYLIASGIFQSPLAGVFALLFFHLSPLNALGGILMMHDSVMYLAWALVVYGFLKYLDTRRNFWLYACALPMALGVLSKHTMVLLPPAIVLLLLWRPEERRLLRNPHAWGAALLAVLLALPLLFWNVRHDFAGLHAILHLPAASSRGRAWHSLMLEFVGSELLLLGPVLFVLLLFVCWRTLRRQPRDAARDFLAFSSLFMFSFFFLFSFVKNVSGNWPVCGYFGGTILLGGCAAEWWRQGRRWLPLSAWGTSGLLVVLGLFPKAMIFAAGIFGLDPGIQALPVLRLEGGREIAAAVDAVREQHPGALLAANAYQPTALLAFYAAGQPRVFSFNVDARPNQYDFWESPNQHTGADFIFLQLSRHDLHAGVATLFESVEASPVYNVERIGRVVTPYRIFYGKGFKGLPAQNPFQELRGDPPPPAAADSPPQ